MTTNTLAQDNRTKKEPATSAGTMDHHTRVKIIAEARKIINSTFIDYKQIGNVLQTLELRLEVGRRTEAGDFESTQAKLTALVAESGTGKSAVVKRFLKSEQVRKMTAEGERILHVKVPAQANIKTCTTSFLRGLGDPLADRHSTTGRNSDRIVRLLRDLNYRFIVVDEFQHLVNEHSSKTPREVSDWLKVLLDEAGVPVLLVGLDTSLLALRGNQQLERRMTKVIRMKPMVWDRGEGAQEFRYFLREFERAMIMLPEASNLSEPRLAHAIHKATGGYVGRVAQLMAEAIEITLLRDSGPRSMTRDDLADAFDGLGFETSNPFHSNLPPVVVVS
jgi:hypothetical protein